MQIIYGEQQKQLLEDRFTILELETFLEEGLSEPMTAYAVIGLSNVPLQEIPVMENFVRMHEAFMKEYKEKNWSFCLQALEHLTGKWSGEIDSFYDYMKKKIETLEAAGVSDDWTPVVSK